MARAGLAGHWLSRLLWWKSLSRWTPVLAGGDCSTPLPQPHYFPSEWIALATSGSTAERPSSVVAGRAGRAKDRMPSAEVQAHLSLYGIDAPKVIQRYPPIASYSVERVEHVTSHLAELGVNVRRVVEFQPVLLAGRVEAHKAVVQLLRDNGVDVVRTIDRNPSVLTRRIASLQRSMDVIANSGHSVARVLNHQPSILRSSASGISSTLRFLAAKLDVQQSCHSLSKEEDLRGELLSSLGLDADYVLKQAPHLLALRCDKMQTVVEYLKGLGVNVPKVARSAPMVFGMRLETLQQRVQFLSGNRLDVVRHVNGYPRVLHYSVEQKLQPTLNFVVQEMGCSPSLLNGAYNVWGCSAENRLRPRFLYLKSLGRSLPALSQFASFSDERFATLLAGTDLQHYHAWRRQNGFSVSTGRLPISASCGDTPPASICAGGNEEQPVN
eukprot:EG_transcript_12354